MKTFSTFFILLGTLLGACGGKENPSGQESKSSKENKSNVVTSLQVKPDGALFGIKSAKIIFSYKSKAENGTDIFWFEDFGKTSVLQIDRKGQYTDTKLTNTWKENSGRVINHVNKNSAKSFFRSKDTEPPTIAITSEVDAKNVGYEILSNEDVAGKSCIVWKNEKLKVKYWLWNNIEMKVNYFTNEGEISIERAATSIEENISIPPELFDIPEGYTGK